MSSPEWYDAQAARLQTHAAALPGLLRPVQQRTGPHVWRGPAAQRFDSQLAGHVTALHAAAEELRAIAAGLRARADALRAELRREALRLEQERLEAFRCVQRSN